MEKTESKKQSKFYEELVNEVKEDFLRRREERRPIEQQWKLNINYVMGNQYCEIDAKGEIVEDEKDYYWQNRNVYNHIAPIVDTRMAKLARVRPVMSVRAAGDEDADLKTAKTATDILNSTYNRLDMDGIITSVTAWSEVTGTGFYKILWDNDAGKKLGEDEKGNPLYEGDVKVICVSPFEIFPDSLFREDIDDCKSIIHAKAMHVNDVYEKYGKVVKGGDVDVFTLSEAKTGMSANAGGRTKLISGVAHDNVLVIERYEKPSKNHPHGRVITIAGDTLLYMGELPYINGIEGRRTFPFAKQISVPQVGSFFGVSIVDRIIPLQRTYNAVKNRKNEFLNRLSMGVMAVEDGSVDTDELSEDGISPGKIIVYRQGASAPQMMNGSALPADLGYEEDRLSSEFISVSGVSEVSRTSQLSSNITSGIALQLLIEQDDTRVSTTGDYIRRAVKQVAKHIIRLFKQFAKEKRIMRIVGENKKVELFYFKGSDISSDDVVFDTENDLSYTPAQKKSAVYDLISTGLLTGEDGKMDSRTKAKVLEILGFGSIDNTQDITNLHINRADSENLNLLKEDVDREEYDDDEVHIAEHTRFILSGDMNKYEDNVRIKERFSRHIAQHKRAKEEQNIAALAKLTANDVK